MSYVIVRLHSWSCDEHPNARCVMDVLGPYTMEEAAEALAHQPEWTAPHLVALHKDTAT